MQSIKYTALSDENLVRLVIREIENNQLPKSLLLNADIYINGLQIPCEEWEERLIEKGEEIEIICNVHVITSLVSLAMVAMPVLALGAINYGVNYATQWIVNKLFPPEEQEQEQVSFKSLADIDGATNSYRPLEPLACKIGDSRVVPDQLLPYFTGINNNELEVYHLFCVSAGDVEVYDLRKENTPIGNLQGIEYHIYRDWRGEPLKWFDYNRTTAQESHKLDVPFVRETPDDVTKLNFIFNAPTGMYNTNLEKGGTAEANINLYFRFINIETLENIDYHYFIQKIATQTVRYSYSFDVPKGKYRCEISANFPWGSAILPPINQDFAGRRFYLETYVIETQFISDKKAVEYTGQSMTLIEMKATASDSLSGGLNSINCMAAMYGKKSDGTLVKSNNLALQIRRLLTDKDLIIGAEEVYIDDESFDAFEAHCDKYGFSGSGYIQDGRSVGSVCSKLAEIGQGYLTNYGGSYFIFYDDPEAERIDTLTARSSWGTTITTAKPINPIDGYNFVFLNKDKDYQQDKRLVYETGVTPKNITSLTHEFIDSAEGAYKYAMLELARAKTRGKIIKTNTDWRSIEYKLGQKILFQHGSFYLGIGTAGKVLEHIIDQDGAVKAVRLDQYYSLSAGVLYAIQDATLYSQRFWDIIVNEDASTNVLYFNVPYDVSNAPKIGKLVSVGETGKVGLMCLIRNITRNADYSASIEMIPAGDNFYSAISGVIPPFVSKITSPTQYDRIKPNVPIILAIVADETTATKDKLGNVTLNARVSMQYVEKSDMEFSYYVVSVTSEETGTQIYNFETKDYFVIPAVRQSHTYDISVSVVNKQGKTGDTASTTFNVVGLLAPPPSITNLTAQIDSLHGVVMSFDNVDVIDFQHYKITGANTSLLTVNNPAYYVPVGVGSFELSVVAVDLLNVESYTPANVTIDILKPKTPDISHSLKTDGLFLEWTDCQTTFNLRHYIVKDTYMSKTHILYDEQLDVSPRPYGDYSFTVQALDIFGNYGDVKTQFISIPQIEAPDVSLSVVGGVLRLAWGAVVSPFPIDYYEVATTNNIRIATTKTTFYDVPPDKENTAGVLELKVRAVDTVGNASVWAIYSDVLEKPPTPIVITRVSEDSHNLVVSWTTSAQQAPIVGYDVVAQYELNGIIYETDYGFFDTNNAIIPALSANVDNSTYRFLVRAVNYMGMIGGWGETQIQVALPSRVFVEGRSIDNNVFLTWNEPQNQFFDIRTYLVEQVDEARNSAVLGYIDAQFFSIFEEKGGIFNYAVTPIDWAGNKGEQTTISVRVSEPPDFEIKIDEPSVFNGEKINFSLSRRGYMVGGISPTETWQQNVDRIAQGVDLKWQEKVDLGYNYFVSPHQTIATYTEIVDNGTIIPNVKISITPSYLVLEGDAIVSCKIETSEDGTNYTTLIDGGFEVYATNFRYVRYTITVTNGIVRFDEIRHKLALKTIRDSGTAQYDASMGFEGVQINFQKSFVDADLPLTQVYGSTFENPLTAYLDFEDVPNPIGFRVFVLDKNGTPTTAKISWQVNGV